MISPYINSLVQIKQRVSFVTGLLKSLDVGQMWEHKSVTTVFEVRGGKTGVQDQPLLCGEFEVTGDPASIRLSLLKKYKNIDLENES